MWTAPFDDERGMSLFAVYMFQITTFVAFLALDEQRVHANRRDLCFWIIVPKKEDEGDDDVEDEDGGCHGDLRDCPDDCDDSNCGAGTV